MANLKVLISSTCYDLGVVRSKLQEFVRGMGYEPILSEYSDVLFDPRTHTHTSCVDEVASCDMVLLLIGARFGGKAVPEAISRIDMAKLKMTSASTWNIDGGKSLSITQLEVLKALELDVPVFAFVDERVLHDHLVYEKNKHTDILDRIAFPSIEKPETAAYIFEFINFLRLKNTGNAITAFSRIDEIELHLRKQWSGLLQRLLREQRDRSARVEQARSIQAQLEELKTAILSSISAPEAREVARGVIKFRRLIDFIWGLGIRNVKAEMLRADLSWSTIMEAANVVEVIEARPRPGRPRAILCYLRLRDERLLGVRGPFLWITRMAEDVIGFAQLELTVKEAVFDAWTEDRETLRHNLIRQVPGTLTELRMSLKEECTSLLHYSTTTLAEPTAVTSMGQDYPVSGVDGDIRQDLEGDSEDIPF